MKIQNLAIIFLIIIIPIIFVFSVYLKLETKTINLQAEYDGKLIEATKEAIEAFEINTVDWSDEYSTLANLKRRDIMASINVFTTSLANKLGIGGTSKENILTYVPAIVYIMYDGYYIYTPTYVPQTITDEKGVQLFYYNGSTSEETRVTSLATQNINGTIVAGEPIYEVEEGKKVTSTYNGTSFTTNSDNAKKTYEHVLKTFVPYTTNLKINGNEYTINYTLDDYVRIYGEDIVKEGYIIEDLDGINIQENSLTRTGETLEENILVKEGANGSIIEKSYKYIYNSNNDKRYYDDDENEKNEKKFFTVNKDYEKKYLPDTTVGSPNAEYYKLSICTDTNTGDFIELYRLLNGNDDKWYYKYSDSQFLLYDDSKLTLGGFGVGLDYSANNYYVETYYFNKWIRNEIIKEGSEDTKNKKIQEILSEKNESIIKNINNNLNLSISNYSTNSKIDYQLPELTDEDWEQALSNISMITFFQGQKIGIKTYNNYVVVTSTQNNEFVTEESLYFIGNEYYHRYGCSQETPYTHSAYRNTEFKEQSYTTDGNTKYYYKHTSSSNENIYECFDCIVNRNNYESQEDKSNMGFYERTLDIALARERYIQMQLKAIITNITEIPIPDINFAGSKETYYCDYCKSETGVECTCKDLAAIAAKSINDNPKAVTGRGKTSMVVSATISWNGADGARQDKHQYIVATCEQSGWDIHICKNYICFEVYNGTKYVQAYYRADIEENKKYNIIGIYDGNYVKIIVNGTARETTETIKFTISQYDNIPTMIGGNPHGTNTINRYDEINKSANFDGKVYEVNVWYNQIFDEKQINKIYNNSKQKWHY